jgi:hypothetical protein
MLPETQEERISVVLYPREEGRALNGEVMEAIADTTATVHDLRPKELRTMCLGRLWQRK